MRIATPALGLLLLLSACGGGSSTTASATPASDATTLNGGQEANGPGAGQTHGAPPQAALDACVGQADGEAYSFTSRRGDAVEGTCATRNGAVACRPLHPMGPPQEAVDACAGLADGAICSFINRRGDAVTGACVTFNGNSACKPDRSTGQGPMSQP
ncbi:MAG: hypothetical protein HQK87_03220 [Nitrospinae bacterium]|nr:hypothetical protein [Nitrospinota bacterium]